MRLASVLLALTLAQGVGLGWAKIRIKGSVVDAKVAVARTEYVIRMGDADGRRWHSDEGGDRRLSTRYDVDDSYSRFHIERTAPDVFRIRVAGTGRILHADDLTTRRVSTHFGRVGDQYSVVRAIRNGNGTWSFRTKASNNWWYLGDGDFLMTNPTPQANSSFYINPDPSDAPFADDRTDTHHAAWKAVVPHQLWNDYWPDIPGFLATLRERAATRRLSAKPIFVSVVQIVLFWTMQLGDSGAETTSRLLALLQRKGKGKT